MLLWCVGCSLQATQLMSLLEGATALVAAPRTTTSGPDSANPQPSRSLGTSAAVAQAPLPAGPRLVAPSRLLLAPRDIVTVLSSLVRLKARPRSYWMQGIMDQVRARGSKVLV